jgi:hypothetical protein
MTKELQVGIPEMTLSPPFSSSSGKLERVVFRWESQKPAMVANVWRGLSSGQPLMGHVVPVSLWIRWGG